MAMHNTNSLLKYAVSAVLLVLLLILVLSHSGKKQSLSSTDVQQSETHVIDNADRDSAAESLQTLTAELVGTKKEISEVTKSNDELKKKNDDLLKKIDDTQNESKSTFSEEIQELKNQVSNLTSLSNNDGSSMGESKIITTVTDLSVSTGLNKVLTGGYSQQNINSNSEQKSDKDDEQIPYYTIPANGTSVKDKLMTALVGRIPVKGVVSDPYPFKIVISDDNLAANGLRVPHLLQMVVSGYCEGDLNLLSVRGWITSLTFVFDDGTISTTTSNDNDIGNFTKSNSLGYLSDEYGNPFIRGKLITNAPTYLGGNVALGMATGAANAYSQGQTTSTSSSLSGTSDSTVTGSTGKYVVGQSLASGMGEASDWWHDRQQQSFDAIYVPTADENNQSINIAVNFAKEIHIDYNKNGRKLSYEHDDKVNHTRNLD